MRTEAHRREREILETGIHWITVVKPFYMLLLAAVMFFLSFFLIKKKGVLRDIAPWDSSCTPLRCGVRFGYRELYRRRDIWVATNLKVIDKKVVFNHWERSTTYPAGNRRWAGFSATERSRSRRQRKTRPQFRLSKLFSLRRNKLRLKKLLSAERLFMSLT